MVKEELIVAPLTSYYISTQPFLLSPLLSNESYCDSRRNPAVGLSNINMNGVDILIPFLQRENILY